MSKGITLFCRLKQLYKMVSLSAAGTVVLLTSPFFLMLSNTSLNGNSRIQHYSLRLADQELSGLLCDLVSVVFLPDLLFSFMWQLFVFCDLCNKMNTSPDFRKSCFLIILRWKEKYVHYLNKVAPLDTVTQASVSTCL